MLVKGGDPGGAGALGNNALLFDQAADSPFK
jgi:hypothetical protein